VLVWLVRSVVAKVNGMLALANTLSNFTSSFPHYSRHMVMRSSKAQDQMSAFQITKMQFDSSSDFKLSHDLRLVENISY
jgi:hypothetical protein